MIKDPWYPSDSRSYCLVRRNPDTDHFHLQVHLPQHHFTQLQANSVFEARNHLFADICIDGNKLQVPQGFRRLFKVRAWDPGNVLPHSRSQSRARFHLGSLRNRLDMQPARWRLRLRCHEPLERWTAASFGPLLCR